MMFGSLKELLRTTVERRSGEEDRKAMPSRTEEGQSGQFDLAESTDLLVKSGQKD
jgi:hypothetical protein